MQDLKRPTSSRLRRFRSGVGDWFSCCGPILGAILLIGGIPALLVWSCGRGEWRSVTIRAVESHSNNLLLFVKGREPLDIDRSVARGLMGEDASIMDDENGDWRWEPPQSWDGSVWRIERSWGNAVGVHRIKRFKGQDE